MANILMINVPYAGHTNPTLPLSQALVKKGHKVVYINAEEYRKRCAEIQAKLKDETTLGAVVNKIEELIR
jgi:Glycosyl transferases, related to UDP-glucuronosyltransferase